MFSNFEQSLINERNELLVRLSAVTKERDKYKEDYEVSFAEWQTAVKTIEDWKDRWTKANEIYKDLLAANTVLRAALEMYAANRSPEWRLSDNGELAEQTLNGLTELQKQVKEKGMR